MIGLSAVQSTLSSITSRYTTLQSSVAQIQISTKPPEDGPGFDGLDADGSGGVSYEEFWAAAQEKRNGGTLTLTRSVAETSIQAASISAEQSSFTGVAASGGYSASIQAELDRALAAIAYAAGETTTVSASESSYESLELEVEIGSGPAPEDAELAELRDKALGAVYGFEAETGIPSIDPYERATERVFGIADSDRDGEISRDEFAKMQSALYGGGRDVGASVTLTASQGYSASLVSSQTAYSMLSASVYA